MSENERDFEEIKHLEEIDEARMRAHGLLATLIKDPDLRSPQEPANPEGLTEVDHQMYNIILASDGSERVFEIKDRPMIIVKKYEDLEDGSQVTYWQAVPVSEGENQSEGESNK